MKKWFKRGLFGLVVLAITALIGTAVFLLTFDPNAYKDKVEQLVYERYQRHLRIEGDVELSLFPRIGLELEQVSLSEHNNDQVFASIDSLRVAIAVWPLLWNRLVVDHVDIDGAKLWLHRDEQGAFNFMDLLQGSSAIATTATTPAAALSPINTAQAQSPRLVPDASQAEFDIDIAGLVLKEGEIHFYDASTQTQLQLVELELNTGRMTFVQPFDVIFKAQLLGDFPYAKAQLEGQAMMQLEPHLHRYIAQRMNMSLVGTVGPYTARNTTLRGAVELLTHTQDVRARQLELTSQGTWQSQALKLDNIQWQLKLNQLNLKHDLQVVQVQKMHSSLSGVWQDPSQTAQQLEAVWEIPSLNIDSGQLSADSMALSFKQQAEAQLLGLNLRTPRLNTPLDALQADAVQVELAGKTADQAWKWTVDTDLQWQQADKKLSWSELNAHLRVDDSRLNPSPAHGELTAQGYWALPEHKLVTAGVWQSANTQAVIDSSLHLGSVWQWDINIDAAGLDLNPWLINHSVPQQLTSWLPVPAMNAVVTPFIAPSDWLIQTTVQADQFNYNEWQLKQLQAELAYSPNHLQLVSATGQLWEGALQASADWYPQQQQGHINTQLTQVQLQDLSNQFAWRPQLAAKGDVQADLKVQGSTLAAWYASLTGTMHLQAASGQLMGLGVWPHLIELNHAVRNVYGGQVQAPMTETALNTNTPFTDLEATLRWQQGQADLSKLQFTAQGLQANVEPHSYFDAVNKQMDINLMYTIPTKALSDEYQSLHDLTDHPIYIRLNGPLARPQYSVQWQRLSHPTIQEAVNNGLLLWLQP